MKKILSVLLAAALALQCYGLPCSAASANKGSEVTTKSSLQKKLTAGQTTEDVARNLAKNKKAFSSGMSTKQKICAAVSAATVVVGTTLGIVYRDSLKNSKLAQYVLKLLCAEKKIECADDKNTSENSENGNKNGTAVENNEVKAETEEVATTESNDEVKTETEVDTTPANSDEVKLENEVEVTPANGDEVKAETDAATLDNSVEKAEENAGFEVTATPEPVPAVEQVSTPTPGPTPESVMAKIKNSMENPRDDETMSHEETLIFVKMLGDMIKNGELESIDQENK